MTAPDSQPSTGVSLDHVTAGGNITIGNVTVTNIVQPAARPAAVPEAAAAGALHRPG